MKNHLKDFPSVLEKIPSNYSITGKNQMLRLSKEGISLSFQVKLLTLQTGTHTHTHRHSDTSARPSTGIPANQGWRGRKGAGHTSLPGVELISPPFVPGERFKHPPKPLPLPPGSTRQLYLEVQIQPLSLFLFALQLLFGEDGDNPLCQRHIHTHTRTRKRDRIDFFSRQHCYLL